MMKPRTTISVRAVYAAIALAGALVASSPALGGPVAQDNEVLLSGGFFHAQDSDFSNVDVQLSYGRYLNNPAWQIGIFQTLSWLIVDDGNDPWSATTAPFFQYNFLGLQEDDRVVPFVGGLGGLAWNDDDATGTVGPLAGLKFFVTDSAFVQTAYRFEWFFDELERADDRSDDGNHIVTVGIGYVWGGTGTR